ncbi:MAG: glucose-6-phosphate isomerase [Bacilli bacterium]|nr:glucose-6-phosphate isomerase [Bacilli bacterium]MDD4077128.1 glucose-6-phosphate isomerase [Bacilli bacterium]MDD4388790.1 glucose-6-phosphate isomerase [Bacilli bacterium]
MISFDYRYVLPFISKTEIKNIEQEVNEAAKTLLSKTGLGNDYLGWIDYPINIEDNEIDRIVNTKDKILKNSDVLVVVGIGGSYLGAQAVLSMLSDYFPQKQNIKIIFAGNTLSATYTAELLKYLEDKDFSLNVISKSGTTTEPAIAFRLLRQLLQKKYGGNHNNRIYCTTTIGKGVLYDLAMKNDYQIFSIPENIGGRYSVFTPVGLLPLAVSGVDIRALIKGAAQAALKYKSTLYPENEALLYAAIRNLLYRKGKLIELLVTYEPKMHFFGEWYKQLYGESEGKDYKGIFPASALYTTDLHSLGQYVQEGRRHLFETVVYVLKPDIDLVIPTENNDFDGLNYLAQKTLEEVNKQALKGTVLAHVSGDVPNIIINISRLTPYSIGQLLYFFMFTCGVSGYLLEINPFNQEGVEAYKQNMFALLGRKGYESLKKTLEEL